MLIRINGISVRVSGNGNKMIVQLVAYTNLSMDPVERAEVLAYAW